LGSRATRGMRVRLSKMIMLAKQRLSTTMCASEGTVTCFRGVGLHAAARAFGPHVVVHHESLRIWIKKALVECVGPEESRRR
jgi:hypothetical protein